MGRRVYFTNKELIKIRGLVNVTLEWSEAKDDVKILKNIAKKVKR